MSFEERFGKKLTFLARIIWTADMGKDRIVGRVGSWVQMPILLLTFLGVYGFRLSLWWLLLILPFTFFGIWLAGFIYVRTGLLNVEQELTNYHNPMLKDIHNKIFEKKEG